MKRTMPLITLAGGAVVGGTVLVASMLATSSAAPASHTPPAATASAATSLASASPATVVTSPSPALSASTSAPTAAPSPAATATSTAPPATGYSDVPQYSDYAAQVNGGGAAVAVSVHQSQAIAYVCDGHTTGQWFTGTAKRGALDLTGRGGTRLTLTYRTAKAAGYVTAGRKRYTFSAPALRGRPGLYQATAVVHGTKVKAGWIVLPDGYQVGVVESGAGSAAPNVTQAPTLDLATDTAQDDGVTLVATVISGITGSGF